LFLRCCSALWFPRLLFWLSLSVAGLLIVSVMVAPLVDDPQTDEAGMGRLVMTLARDVVVRRTTIAGAVGLIVTAFVFFRPSEGTRSSGRASKSKAPPTKTVGA
jgi:hypothetical protein